MEFPNKRLLLLLIQKKSSEYSSLQQAFIEEISAVWKVTWQLIFLEVVRVFY